MNKIIYDDKIKNNKKKNLNSNLVAFEEETVKSILTNENNYIVSDKYELANLVKEALSDVSSDKNLHLGIIPSKTINRIKSEITDIKKEKIEELFKDGISYALVINQKEIRHMKKDSLTVQDVINFVCSLDDIIVNFDKVRNTLYNNSQNALRFRKKVEGSTIIALEVISNKKHTIRTHTLFYDIKDFKNKKRKHIPNA